MRFVVSLERQHLCGSPDAHSADLERAYVAAKRAQWDELRALLCPADRTECRLPLSLVSSVPPGHTYSILHQLAYHNAVGVYQELQQWGVHFDLSVLTGESQGKTAEQVAAERGHAEFAQLMAASQQLVRVKSVPTPAAVVLEGRLVYRSSAGVFSDVRAETR